MLLKHVKTIIEPQLAEAGIMALTWSSNNKKLAVCTSERVVVLYDENGDKKDKFATKPISSEYGKRSYVVKGMAFSPDSTKLAIGQTDNICFVYKLGDGWNEKKSICNKFPFNSSVTCLIWLPDNILICGLADGKVMECNPRSNKSKPVYSSKSYVVAVCHNPSGKGILSGHADGTIYRYFYDDEGSGDPQGKICVNPSPPYALAWGSGSFIAAGCDRRVLAYGREGKVIQQFDYTQDKDEYEFTVAACTASGQSVAVGSYDRIRLFNWSGRKGQWEESPPKEIKNMYTVTTLVWKADGSKLVAGTMCGGVEQFDCSLKKILYKNKFEITYIGPNQVMVKDRGSGKKINVRSTYGYQIDEVKVKILDNNQFIIAHTSDTLLLADWNNQQLSEVPWPPTSGNEKFYFDNKNVCMVFNAGELSLIEYGTNEVLSSVRTEFMNAQLISVRVNERKQRNVAENKKMAYLIDQRTVAVVDLVTGMNITQVSTDSKIDWLELNETAHKLLIRDKNLKLYLYDLDTEERSAILNHCAFVQWVAGSDVVIAQSRNNLCIWYNIEHPERVSMESIKGDIESVVRVDGKTQVVVNEGVGLMNYNLDEELIEFGTAIEDGDYGRAVGYLESLDDSPEAESMWRTLCKLAIENQQYHIAERCYAALGNVSQARYLSETNRIAEDHQRTTGSSGYSYYKVRARLAIFECNFKLAESVYLEQNALDEAMDMYKMMDKWDECLDLAETKNHPQLEQLRRDYHDRLMKTGQFEKAGELKERDGDFMGALNLYMQANRPTRAASLITSVSELAANRDMVKKVAMELIKAEFFERAGDLFEKTGDNRSAMECYRTGKAYRRAVELARLSFPEEVVKLEEEWGTFLVHQKQLDAAINHFIEAGANLKAVEAAISSRQWTKAVQILELQDKDVAAKYYYQIASHYASISDHESAERYYVLSGRTREAIDMYNTAGKWEQAHRLASTCMRPDEVVDLYKTQARNLEQEGKFREAERLYCAIEKPEFAISMYKKQKMFGDMIRLVKQYHPDLLTDTHRHLAKELEDEGSHRQAEFHYLQSGGWKEAVNMYRTADNWEEAYRVAKNNGSANAANNVAFLWAKNLGGESAVRLLNKFALLEKAIDSAADNCSFDFAFDLARTGMKNKMGDIHLKYAMFLEDAGKFDEAEQNFIKANRPKEAVLMYVHLQDWDSAQRVAEKHDPDSVSDVLVGQARNAFEDKQYQKGESLLLRAERPDAVVKYYKSHGMWQDALRVCKEYLPHKLEQLQDEYDRAMVEAGNAGAESLVKQAMEWEQNGDYERAVQCYVKVTDQVTNDKRVLEKCWMKAGELSVKHLDVNKAAAVAKEVGPRLSSIGKFNAAAELLLSVDLIKEAIDVLIANEEFNKAKKVANELNPRLVGYVDDKYKEHLRSQGKADELKHVDPIGALDMLIEQGKWEECIDKAASINQGVLHKYLALYATELIKQKQTQKALTFYEKYGTPAISQNYNIYKRIATDVFSMKGLNGADAYHTWASLRNMMFDLCENIGKSRERGSPQHDLFEKSLLCAHYYATRSAAQSHTSLEAIAGKLNVSLLRHTDVIPVDKAFFEAGQACKGLGWESMAFVFVNRYLDLVEAIDEGSPDMLDDSDLQGTDIPLEVPLPAAPHLTDEEHESLKDWVLAVSMSQTVEQQLPTDERGVYEASLEAPNTGIKSLPCVVTGYPVLKGMEFKKPGKSANRDDWNKLLMATKVSRSAECQDVLSFIKKWCGEPMNSQYSFQ